MSIAENQWVLLTSVSSHSEALVVCSKLRGHDVQTFVKDQHISTLLGTGVSGFKIDIYVLISDYEKALDLYYDNPD